MTLAHLKTLTLAAAAVGLLGGCSLFEDEEERLEGVRIPVRATADVRTTAPELRSQIQSLSSPVSNAEWTQVNGGPTHVLGHVAAGASLARVWSSDIGSGGGDSSRLTAQPVVAAGRVYTLDAASRVSAFNASSGALAWRFDAFPEGEDGDEGFGGGIAFEAGRLFVTTGFGDVIALDASSGSEIWRQDAGAPVRAAPTVAQGIVIAVARDNSAYAYRAEDGGLLWRVTGAASGAGVLGGSSAAISNGGVAVLPFGTGELVAVRLGTGRRVWSDVVSGSRRGLARSAITDITGGPVIQGVAVIAGNSNGQLVAIDGRSGRRGWTREFGAAGPIWADGQTFYMITDDAQVKRLSSQDGSTLWTIALAEYEDPEDREDVIRYGGPVLAGGRLLIASSEGRLLSLDPQTGQELSAAEISGLAGITPVVAGGLVYVVTDGGSLVALR